MSTRTPRRPASRPTRTAIATLLLGGAALVGCGGTASSAGGTTTTQPSVAPAFCEALLAFDAVPDPGPARIAVLRRTAPGPLEDSVRRYAIAAAAGKADSAAATRDLDLVHAWAHGNCGFQRVDVEVRDDNRFRGIDEELQAGPTSFEVLSTAEVDTHEMVLLRRAYDDETPIYNQLDDYRHGRRSGLERVASVKVAPGETAGTTTRLTRGDYLVVSLLPDPDEHNEPRYLNGMIAEFTVE